jgi:hypothetical protein
MPQPPETREGGQGGQGTWGWEEEEGAPAAAGAGDPASSGQQQQEWTAAPGASWGNWGRKRDRGHRGDPDPAPAAEEGAGSRLSRPVARAPVHSSGQKPGHFPVAGQGAGAGSRGTAIQGGDGGDGGGTLPPMDLEFGNAPPPGSSEHMSDPQRTCAHSDCSSCFKSFMMNRDSCTVCPVSNVFRNPPSDSPLAWA